MHERVPGQVREKLTRIFTINEDIVLAEPPPKKVREEEKLLTTKKGIIAWSC